MSAQTPSNAEEVRQAITVGRPFAGTKVNGETIAVLSGALHGEILTGPLAGEVMRTMLDYSEQYLTGGGRNRPAWHVVYYVTVSEPDAERGRARRVVGYLTADGGSRFTDTNSAATGRPTIPGDLYDAILALQSAGMVTVAANLATDRGDYPLQDDPVEGVTFTLWSRDTREPIGETLARAHFTDRHVAYAAKVEAEASGEPYVSPTGFRGTRGHAWITRDASPVPLGTPYADYRAARGEG